jgi:hypothetical protein
MATGTEGEWPGWITGAIGTTAGILGTIGIALINRKPALNAAVDARLRTLIDGYEQRVTDLTQEVISLRNEVVSLRKALDAGRGPTGFGA